MKKLSYLLLAQAILFSACSKGPHYVITGNIKGADSLTFLLQERVSGQYVTLDSAVARKGIFKMKGGPVRYPEMVILNAKNTRDRTSFYLENSEITITGSLDSLDAAKITGSRTQDEYNAFRDSNKPLSEKYSKLNEDFQFARQNNDTARVSAIRKEAAGIDKEMIQLQKDFVKNHPASYVTPYILAGLSMDMDGSELELYLNGLDTAVANTPLIKELKERAGKMKTVSVGQKAPDFTLNDPEGKQVSLYSKVGSKLLLIDFWAGWCGPCRRENPNVVRIYKEFSKKGFDVFGVSLDRRRDEWVQAINDDHLTWTQVSDLQEWDNAAARLYAVNSIPANFLLDQNGTIIARDLRGDELYNKVKEVVGR
ncbi:MAG: TlpA disulfide reductase family protein [Bacteroidota bacterium]|nr:TlpA disulfide reductase family protein [Bacteroidota bacterium]